LGRRIVQVDFASDNLRAGKCNLRVSNRKYLNKG
jgi:hypothetical protein